MSRRLWKSSLRSDVSGYGSEGEACGEIREGLQCYVVRKSFKNVLKISKEVEEWMPPMD